LQREIETEGDAAMSKLRQAAINGNLSSQVVLDL
tara:strand:+ start:148 stop:249 length:102 start_codon:yes stop_codon:yes gene_type:complete